MELSLVPLVKLHLNLVVIDNAMGVLVLLIGLFVARTSFLHLVLAPTVDLVGLVVLQLLLANCVNNRH